MVALGFGLVAPALPLFAREFGVGDAAAGAVVSAFALMRLVMAPFVGRLVNAFGERLLLAAGLGVVAVRSVLAGLSRAAWHGLRVRGRGGGQRGDVLAAPALLPLRRHAGRRRHPRARRPPAQRAGRPAGGRP